MRISKHHVLGNDFLICLDPQGTARPSDAEVVALCDRRRGIGADGFVHAVSGEPVRMELRNADASPAEMSGNGVSCLAQALVLHGWAEGPTVEVGTVAGLRSVEVLDRPDPQTMQVRVYMGQPTCDAGDGGWLRDGVADVCVVQVGNPHVVARVASLSDAPELAAYGSAIDRAVEGGTNVHLVEPGDAPGELAMRSFERGAGLTDACGTGAVAAGVAASRWGIGAGPFTVRQPGGDALVELAVDGSARLTVTANAVAAVEWPWPGGCGDRRSGRRGPT